ncbi:hypothetical protein FRC11_006514, partial [Ceratobasidium sp. 423]
MAKETREGKEKANCATVLSTPKSTVVVPEADESECCTSTWSNAVKQQAPKEYNSADTQATGRPQAKHTKPEVPSNKEPEQDEPEPNSGRKDEEDQIELPTAKSKHKGDNLE